MSERYKQAGASTVGAEITAADGGGFTAVASNDDVDRDGEVIAAGCFSPLPPSIPVHLDHTMSAASLVGRGRPFYVGRELRIDAQLASTADAQVVRQKVADGVIDSLSIVFRGLEWKDVDGVRTCVKGELLACDLVSVPSNPGARILTARSWRKGGSHPAVQEARLQGLLALAEVEIADARRVLKQYAAPANPTTADVRRFLRNL